MRDEVNTVSSVYVPSRVVPGHTIMRPGTHTILQFHAGIATLHMVDMARRNSTFLFSTSEPALDGRDFFAKKFRCHFSLPSRLHTTPHHGGVIDMILFCIGGIMWMQFSSRFRQIILASGALSKLVSVWQGARCMCP